jgi:hypothetical protein
MGAVIYAIQQLLSFGGCKVNEQIESSPVERNSSNTIVSKYGCSDYSLPSDLIRLGPDLPSTIPPEPTLRPAYHLSERNQERLSIGVKPLE